MSLAQALMHVFVKLQVQALIAHCGFFTLRLNVKIAKLAKERVLVRVLKSSEYT
jgi:hypothetical protein